MCHGQAVYEEDLVHRGLGDCRTLTAFEQPFPVAAAWVQQEAIMQPAVATDDTALSFTRWALKPWFAFLPQA